MFETSVYLCNLPFSISEFNGNENEVIYIKHICKYVCNKTADDMKDKEW